MKFLELSELKKLAYVVPHAKAFKNVPGGHVTHIAGVINGFASFLEDITLYADVGAITFSYKFPCSLEIEERDLSSISNLYRLASSVRAIVLSDANSLVLVRKHALFVFFLHLLIPRKSKRAAHLSIEVNGLFFDFTKKGRSKFLHQASTLGHKFFLEMFDSIYVVNDDLKQRLCSGVFAISPDNVFAIHNGGPDPDKIEHSNSPELSTDEGCKKVQLFFYGILQPYNDFDLVFDAVEKWNSGQEIKLELNIIGFGPMETYIEHRAACDPCINFHGKMHLDDFAEFVSNDTSTPYKYALVPFKYDNGSKSLSPIKAFEYMCVGLPIIKSNNCLENIVRDGENGFEYRKSSIEDFLAVIDRVSQLSYATYSKLVMETNIESKKNTWDVRMREFANQLTNQTVR